MSLDVDVYIRNEAGQRDFFRIIDYKSLTEGPGGWRAQGWSLEQIRNEIARLHKASEPWKTLAGPEKWRTEIYGSPAARSLGLTLLPSLSEKDIYAEGEELDALGSEIETLIQNIGLIVPDREDQRKHVLERFQNIANAVAEAKSLNGGVVIW